jgi:hypothetical protein
MNYLQPVRKVLDNASGKVGVPILLWFLGVPGGVVLIPLLFLFSG